MLNAWGSQGNTTLTLGNSGSSDFYGIIQDRWSSQVGSIVKEGDGPLFARSLVATARAGRHDGATLVLEGRQCFERGDRD